VIDGISVLALIGEHDLSTQPSLGDALDRCLADGARVLVDLSQAEFIDSSVLRSLLRGFDFSEREGGGRFGIVVAPGSFPERLLHLVKISPVVATYATREEALRALSDGG
jgi:anti-anti-sigma factor